MYQHIKSQAGQHGVLELGVVVHDDCDNSHVGQEPASSAHHVLPVQPELAGGVEAPVVHTVVVPLGQELDAAVLLLVELQHSVHDGNVSTLDLEDHDLPHPDLLLLVVCEEEQVAPLEGWLHAATEDHNYGRL